MITPFHADHDRPRPVQILKSVAERYISSPEWSKGPILNSIISSDDDEKIEVQNVTMIKVEKDDAEALRLMLLEMGLFSKKYSIVREEDHVLIPLARDPNDKEISLLGEFNGELLEDGQKESLMPLVTPYEDICNAAKLPEDLTQMLPRKWEMLGDVLVLRLPGALLEKKKEIAELYSSVLGAKTVLLDKGIRGRYREPVMEVLFGDDTETICLENGIRYKLDASKIMFSSGNIDERIRMGKVVRRGEVVVDLFSGIGYFAIPAVVHGGASRVVACEMNPVAHAYLCENIRLNGVDGKVEARLGDCREVAPKGVADRVIMGYLVDTHEFLEVALLALKEEGGIIHYHEQCIKDDIPDGPVGRVHDAATRCEMRVEVSQVRCVKSVAPYLYHVVVDAKISRWQTS